ncbi:hypothetical protein E4P29_25395 [Rhodococcus sp. 1R11]|uniref:hypothetical protein n=1 Tax=Rhodococcus sp. 1R11 TaxID=2559614 RepID=UPI0010717D54|nr:hypothetical protein [Rhodococcus sp. 1R11]TFI40249.1 hypothetical protein E4P29_25395 [Rhodococcus sp. 1R11]
MSDLEAAVKSDGQLLGLIRGARPESIQLNPVSQINLASWIVKTCQVFDRMGALPPVFTVVDRANFERERVPSASTRVMLGTMHGDRLLRFYAARSTDQLVVVTTLQIRHLIMQTLVGYEGGATGTASAVQIWPIQVPAAMAPPVEFFTEDELNEFAGHPLTSTERDQ